ncbi:MAG: glycosyltransferase family 2 protein [Mucilaginibacter sp.]|uniref:glycosyltransferase family 2 protein n=1 Tax=Mucilaginibacter sp. TaxID=1882438 RepID=UPI0032672328
MMNQQPLVSVALCVYNGEKYLELQLDSILNQDYQNLEVIAVNDCSKDNSQAILESYVERYSNLKVFNNEKNLGYVKNFERAITLCEGKYIALSDQDDIWHPQKISKQVAAIGDAVLIYHDSEFIDEEGNSLNKNVSDILNLYEGDSPLPFLFMNCVSGHAILFDNKLIEYALPFNPQFFHDWWLAFVAGNVGSVKVIREPLVKYRQHTTNTIDILESKRDMAVEKPNELLDKKAWAVYCGTFNGQYSEYIKRITRLVRRDLSFFSKLQLYYLMLKHKREFQYISKSPLKRQAKDIKTLVFGIHK